MGRGTLQIAIVMQGSDFINVTIVPSMDVRQYDLGDVFLSPCPANTFSPGHEGVCRDCTVCPFNQYDSIPCVSYRDSTCSNCTECTDTEREICACGQTTTECYLGDRVCAPLAPVSINITFSVSFSVQLSRLQLSFFQEGMRSGFILFMGNYLQVTTDHIVLLSLSQVTPYRYQAMYLAQNVYSQYAVQRLDSFTDAVVQAGLAYTFGWGGTFPVSRRLLQVGNVLPVATVANTGHSCVASDCPRFFVKSQCALDCCPECTPGPCDAGYTGDLGRCTPCPNATYKDSVGNATCSSCPMGYTSDEGSVNSSQCWLAPTTPVSTSARVVTSVPGLSSVVTPVLSSVVGTSTTVTSSAAVTSSGVVRFTSSMVVTSSGVLDVTSSTVVGQPVTTSSSAPASMSVSSSTVTSNAETAASTTVQRSSLLSSPVPTSPAPVPAPAPGPAGGSQAGTQYYVSGNYMVITNQNNQNYQNSQNSQSSQNSQTNDTFLHASLVFSLLVSLLMLACMAAKVSSSSEMPQRRGRVVYIPVPVDDPRANQDVWNPRRQDVWMD